MDFSKCTMQPLTMETATIISQWEYEKPYDVYNFKGHSNGYLMDKTTWGVEQFALIYNDEVIGQVACQYDNNDLWVGWSLSPTLYDKGNGYLFIQKCVEEIRKIKNYNSKIYLRVSASNKRAIKAYQNAGFVYLKTIQDEIAYTNHFEDFWVMIIK
ncbi:MAG: GNAT family protein [Oscillospiraceae bacterium]